MIRRENKNRVSVSPQSSYSASSRAFRRTVVVAAAACLGVLGSGPQEASAQVTLNASDAFGNSSFNSAGNWSVAAAPSAGSTYTVSGNRFLRTPNASASLFSFGGASLTLSDNGILNWKGGTGGTINVTNLNLNGGQILNNTGTSWTLSGGITVSQNGGYVVTDNSTVNAVTNTISAAISGPSAGTGTLNVFHTGSNSGNSVTALTGNNSFTLPLNVANGTLRVGSATAIPSGTVVTLGSVAPNGAGGFAGQAATFDLGGFSPAVGGLRVASYSNVSFTSTDLTAAANSLVLTYTAAFPISGVRPGQGITIIGAGGATTSAVVRAINPASTVRKIYLSANAPATGPFTVSFSGANPTAASQVVGNSSTVSDSVLTFSPVGSGAALTSSFAGTIQDTLGAGTRTVGVTVTAGLLTLSGPNSFTGPVTVSGGTLAAGSATALGNTASVTVGSGGTLDVSGASGLSLASGSTLQGAGTVRGAYGHAAGTISPGTAGTPGTLTFAAGASQGLTLAGGAVRFELASTSASAGDRIDALGGLSISGITNVSLEFAVAPTTAQTYRLINYSGALGGAASQLRLTSPTFGGRAISLDSATAGQINVTVNPSAAPGTLVWNAPVSSVWDLNNTANFRNTTPALASDVFYNGDQVTFDDTPGVQTSVSLATSLIPSVVIVDSSANAFSFSGPGSLAGTAGLIKSGTSTLTVATNNSHSGTNTITGGILRVGAGGAAGSLGTGPVVNSATLAFARSDSTTFANAISGPGSVVVSSGRVTLSGNNTFTGPVVVQNSATLSTGNSPAPLGATSGVTVESGGQLYLNATSATGFGAAPLTLDGSGPSGTGALRVGGAAYVDFNSLPTIHSYAGPVTLASDVSLSADGGAQLRLTHPAALDLPTGTTRNVTLVPGTADAIIGSNAGISIAGDLQLNGGVVDVQIPRFQVNNPAGGPSFGSFGLNFLPASSADTIRVKSTIVGVGPVSFGGEISRVGSVVQLGGGTVIVESSNAYSGGTMLMGGRLIPTTAAALGAAPAADAPNTIYIAGNNQPLSELVLQGGLSIAQPLYVGGGQGTGANSPQIRAASGDNTLAYLPNGLSGNPNHTVTFGFGGTEYNLRVDAGATLTVAGDVTWGGQPAGPTGTRRLHLDGAGQGTISGVISNGTANNGASIEVRGPGSWALSGLNTFTNAAIVSGGGTLVANSLADGNVPSSIGQGLNNAANRLLLSGGTLKYVGPATSSNRLFTISAPGGTLDASGTGPVVLASAGGAIVSANTANKNAFFSAGSTTIDIGVLPAQLVFDLAPGMTVTGTGIAPGSRVVSVDHLAGTFTLDTATTAASAAAGNALSFGGVDRTLTLTGSNTGDNTIAGNLVDPAAVSSVAPKLALAKTGAGLWVLSGTNSFTGPVTVTGGTLVARTPLLLKPTGGGPAVGAVVVTGQGATLRLDAVSIGTNGYTTAGEFAAMTIGSSGQTGVSTVALAKVDRSTANAALVVTSALTIDAASGFLDLGTGDLIVRGGAATPAALSTLRSYAQASLASGATKVGLGTTSAAPFTTVAVFANAAQDGSAYFVSYDGVTSLTASDAIVKYTYVGDTNLDGTLDARDLTNLIEGFSTGATGWENGDLNYDGAVTAADLALFQAASAYFTNPANAAPSLGSGAGAAAGNGGAVPEPASVGLLFAAAPLLGRRRRR